MNDFLNQFALPEQAREELAAMNLTQKVVNQSNGGAVSTFEMNGHDKGIAIRFVRVAVPNKVKSEEFDIEVNDEVDLIEWIVSKRHKPTERVTMCGDHLLKFRKERVRLGDGSYTQRVVKDESGNPICTGGKFKDAYIAWKNGQTIGVGLPIERWGRLSIGQIATLHSLQIFTVEQFASLERNQVDGRMPPDLVDAFESAIQYVNAQAPMQDIKKYADEVFQLRQQIAKQAQEIDVLREGSKKKVGRPRKTQVVVNEPEEEIE